MSRIRPSWTPPSLDNANTEHVLGFDWSADVGLTANGLWWWQPNDANKPANVRALLWKTSDHTQLADSGTISTTGFTVGAWTFLAFTSAFSASSSTTYTAGVYSTGATNFSSTDLTGDQVSGDGHVRALATFGRFLNVSGAVFPTSTWSGMHAVDLDYTIGATVNGSATLAGSGALTAGGMLLVKAAASLSALATLAAGVSVPGTISTSTASARLATTTSGGQA